jgi:hypothetical protein
MKKIAFALAVLTIATVFVGCKGSEEPAPTNPPTNAAPGDKPAADQSKAPD